jgi:recombination protein RecA
MPRPVLKKEGGLFFSSPKTHLSFVSSGCAVLDCVLGGGWPLGRMANLVGDKSTGKTLLAIEAFANFRRQFPDGKMAYCETEAAFDDEYARALGLDMEGVHRPDVSTVEDLFEDLLTFIKRPGPGIYVVDSLDALSDKAEQERKISDSTYGASKPKQLGQLFRRLIKPLERSQTLVLIISQVRDNIGVAFGEKHTRSGGKALDFYASQILWLANIGQVKKTINKITRTVGVNIRAKCKKNKIGMPFRECEFKIVFGYGIDDKAASRDFLAACGKKAPLTHDSTREAVQAAWFEIEKAFLPKGRKYE